MSCYDRDECVGQIRLRKNWNKYAFIEDIAVSKNHRSKGTGRRLVQKAIELAKQKDLLGLMLETQDVNTILNLKHRQNPITAGNAFNNIRS